MFWTAWQVGILALSAMSGVDGQAPGSSGEISGLVVDASEAPVPDATVEVVNLSKGLRRETATNRTGMFTFSSLPPDNDYVVTVNKSGFAVYKLSRVEILLGQDVHLSVRLEVGQPRSEIRVEGSPMVEPTKAGISQVIESAQISNLPINGRRVDAYVLLTPAVVPDGNFGLISFRGVAAGNTFLTDGNDTTNLFYYENAGRTRVTAQISQDAVQEFRVSSSGYSAEYGRASGGVVNTLTRSGSNDWHGAAYWYFRNRTLNARDPYSDYNPPEWRHQMGASLGGSIRKDKLFFFFNQEDTRRNFPLVASLKRAPLFDGAGHFIGSCQATAEQCAAALRFLGRQFQVLPRSANSELAFGRLDWSPSAKHQVTASFNYLRWQSPNGERTQAVLTDGSGVGNNANSSVRTRWARLSWTMLRGGTLSFESRFGWFQDRLNDDLNDALTPSATGRVQINVQGQGNLGVGPDYPRLDPRENRFQLAQTIRKIAGRHSWTFGGDWLHTSDFRRSLSNREGTYSYATFTDFASDFSGNTQARKRWQSYSQRFGSDTQDTTVGDYSLFAQDQMQFSPRLTMNYGLRYEYERLSQPTTRNPAYPDTGRIPQLAANLAPRVGLSYALTPKTVFRLGYGMFFARIQGGLINTLFLDNGLYQKSVNLDGSIPRDRAAGPVFPDHLAAFDPALTLGASDLSYASPNFKNGYTQQGDVSFERELARNLGLTASYLWSRGNRLTTVRDANVGDAGPHVTYILPNGGQFETPTYLLINRVDPLWRRVNAVESKGESFYKAMVIQLRRRFTNGLQGSLAYTLSKAEDLGMGGAANNIFFNQGPRSLMNGEYKLDKGRSELDEPQRLVVTTIWEPALTPRSGWFYRNLVMGWQLSQISTFASPQYVSPTIFVAGTPFPGAAFSTTINGFGGSPRVPFLEPNSLPIDTIARTDARLTKIVALTERVRLQLHFEVFNLLNHVSATSINTQAYELSNGVLTPTPGLGQGVASGGYPDGTNARRAQVSLRLAF